MSDPRILSLDTETYGKQLGQPDQTCFSPRRSLLIDGATLQNLVLTCCLTLPKEDPRWPPPLKPGAAPAATGNANPTTVQTADWDATRLASLSPGPTIPLILSHPKHRAHLYRWLLHADTLLGMNLAFDLSYLRALCPLLRSALVPFRHTIIDLSYTNYLQCESRPEKSLKNLGPILGTHVYNQADLQRLTTLPEINRYCGQDTTNTLVAISHLASLISQEQTSCSPTSSPSSSDSQPVSSSPASSTSPSTTKTTNSPPATTAPTNAKLSPFSISLYSDTIWSCVLMSEAGVPFSHSKLLDLATSSHATILRCETDAPPLGLKLSGPGSKKSKSDFLNTLVSTVDSDGRGNSVLNNPLLTFTPKTREISFSDSNRSLLLSLLPKDSPLHILGRLCDEHAAAQKLLSTYCYPLLYHRRNDPTSRASLLVPQPGIPTCLTEKTATPSPQPESPPVTKSPKRTKTTSKRSSAPDVKDTSASFPASENQIPSESPSSAPSISPTEPTNSSPLPNSWIQTLTPNTTRPPVPGTLNPDTWLSHPTWFIVPTTTKDSSGSQGGTLQGRITCLHGDTSVITSEGDMPIREAVQKKVDIVTFDRKTGRLFFTDPKPVEGGTQPLLKITYSGRNKTSFVLCTPEHRWVLRSGEFIEAKSLRKGHSLRHVYRYTDHHGYPCLRVRGFREEIKETLHSMNVHGLSTYKGEVHHKDEDKSNFRRSNLETHTRSSHQSIHSSKRKNKVIFRCENCDEEVTARASVHKHRFCGLRCWGEFRRNNYRVESVELVRDGRVFCFQVPGNETFLLSDGLVSGNCKNAAHQTDPPEIQSCIQSRWHGGYIVGMDLKQIELCVPALLSGEPFFFDAITNGRDLHSRATILLWGEDTLFSRYPTLRGHQPEEWKDLSPLFSKRERQVGKRTNFAHLFRSGADTMQRAVLGDIGELLPLPFFQRIVAARPTEFPVLWAWQEARIHEARTTGRVTLPFTGQSRSFLGGDKYEVNEIVNFPIQTTAGNTLLRIQSHLLRSLQHHPSILCYLNVYDALKFDCRTQEDVTLLTSLIAESVAWVQTHDYWHHLQTLHSRVVPLAYELKTHGPHPLMGGAIP